MHVTVTLGDQRRELRLADDATGTDLLQRLDLTPEQAILVVDGGPAPYTGQLPAGGVVKVVRVASGG
ncbi:MAG: small archaeal modifier protein 2 [Thermoplasmatota archaeon]